MIVSSIEMALEGLTEGQYRYMEQDKGVPMAIGLVFIRKFVFRDKPPETITLNIEVTPPEAVGEVIGEPQGQNEGQALP